MASGIRRKVDDLGRVVIPSSIRKVLGIGEGDQLEFAVEGERIVLTRPAEACAFCGGRQHLEAFRDKVVCWSCLAGLRATERARHPFGA